MDLITPEVTTQDLNIAVYKEGVVLSVISYILRTYAYFVIGTILTLVNIPVFLLVMTRKALRSSYLVLAIVFLNNGFTGISAILDTAGGERLIDHHNCVLNVPLLLLTTYCLNGLSLLMNSMERLQSVYSPLFYKALLLLISSASLMSVAFMVVVVIILKKKFSAQFLTTHSYNRDLSHFLDNQKRYTQTALISCCFTFFLAVVPSMVQYCHILDPSTRSRTVVIACVYLPFLNSFNIITLFVCRQGDLRRAAIYSFKSIFYKRKHQIQSTTVVGS